jgi:hypothetical protein
MAPAIAIRPEQAEAMRAERGYEDIDPTDVWEQWKKSRSAENRDELE